MKRVPGAFALVILAAAGVAAAQTTTQSAPPAGTMPQSQYPSSTAPAPSESTSGSMSSDSHSAKKQEMKACIAREKAGNSGMSKTDIKKYCKQQVESANASSGSHNK